MKGEIQVSVIDTFLTALKNDPEYYRSWKDNIAMAFKDAYNQSREKQDNKTIHEIANEAADNFLQLLIK